MDALGPGRSNQCKSVEIHRNLLISIKSMDSLAEEPKGLQAVAAMCFGPSVLGCAQARLRSKHAASSQDHDFPSSRVSPGQFCLRLACRRSSPTCYCEALENGARRHPEATTTVKALMLPTTRSMRSSRQCCLQLGQKSRWRT